MSDRGDANGCLDLESFPVFVPLLEACQDYARLSGCRFPRGALQTFEELSGSEKEMLSARRKAAPLVIEFKARLKQQEQELLETVQRAYRLLMNESVRNAIVAMCRELDLWPPKPPPAGILADDCAYEDTSAPLPEIAQRAYNDEARRGREDVLQPLLKRATTASFIVDFATEVGVEMPAQSQLHLSMLEEFMSRAEEWGPGPDARGQVGSSARARKALMGGLGSGRAAESLRLQVKDRWSKNWESTGGTLLNVATVGLAMAAAAITVHRSVARGRK